MMVQICRAAIELINGLYKENLDINYKLPKIRSGYKGADDASASGGAVPARTIRRKLCMTAKEIEHFQMRTVSREQVMASAAAHHSQSPSPVTMQHPAGVDAATIKFLKAGERVLATAVVNKPNPMGISKERTLVLTNNCRLFYYDAKDPDTLKGEIVWTPAQVPRVSIPSVRAHTPP